MIESISHKGLKRFFEKDDESSLRPDQVERIRRILLFLNRAKKAEDMNLPGYSFHKLSGNLKGFFSVKVNRNWRIIFRFEEGNAYDITLIDYH